MIIQVISTVRVGYDFITGHLQNEQKEEISRKHAIIIHSQCWNPPETDFRHCKISEGLL